MTFSNNEKAAEAEREVMMRKDVYARFGNSNAGPTARLTPLQKKRIALMQEIADDYRRLAQLERLL